MIINPFVVTRPHEAASIYLGDTICAAALKLFN